MKIQNPHDKFFKETFSNVEVARDFIKNYLPENILKIIDLETLELQKDSFINEELQEVFSDMLFQVAINKQEGYVYFLFEHKSYPSKGVAFQLLNYMVRIWEQKIKKELDQKIPVVIPLVVYHGKDQWKIKTSLGEMIRGYEELPEDVRRFIPNYQYLLYDLSTFSDQEIKGEARLRILLSVFRDIFKNNSDELLKVVYNATLALDELEDQETGIEYFETFMRYVFNAGPQLTKDELEKMIHQIDVNYPKGSEMTMTLAEVLRKEGYEDGIEQGIEKGETKALVKTVMKLLTKKFGVLPADYREKIGQLDVFTLEMIIDEIWDCDSLVTIEKYFIA
jgi:predicted transposase/invertase (TIGR01784 family)